MLTGVLYYKILDLLFLLLFVKTGNLNGSEHPQNSIGEKSLLTILTTLCNIQYDYVDKAITITSTGSSNGLNTIDNLLHTIPIMITILHRMLIQCNEEGNLKTGQPQTRKSMATKQQFI